MKKINVGLIGFGLAGRVFHEPLISSIEGMIITKVLSSRKEELLSILPDAEIVDHIDHILDDPAIDLVINCGPNTVHYSYTKKALEAKKNIIVEKPFVISISEGRELIELAKKNNVILSVFQNRRFDSDFLTIKKLFEANKFGQIKEFESHFDRYQPLVRENKWREKKGLGNGILFDLGSHLIDQMLCLFGEPVSLIADVCAQKDEGEVTDYFHLIFKYSNGLRVILHSSSFGDTSPRFRVVGERGSYIKYGMDPQEGQSREGIRPNYESFGVENKSHSGIFYTWRDEQRLEEVIVSERGCYRDYYQNISNIIKGETQEYSVRANEALRVVELIEAAYTSSREAREIIFLKEN